MAQNRRRKRGISWELVGLAAIVGVFLIGGLVWLASTSGADPVAPPDFSSVAIEGAAEGSPAERTTGVDADDRPYIGDPAAPVVVYEFADFQCPHCKQFATVDATSIKADYIDKGTVKLVFVNFPFLGDESNQAARAAVCAGEQGHFWAMHDWLFANQATVANTGGFSRGRLEEIAGSAGLDVAAFSECLSDGATTDRVRADRDFGTELGVDATPSFAIGEQLELLKGPSLTDLRTALDQAVAAQQ